MGLIVLLAWAVDAHAQSAAVKSLAYPLRHSSLQEAADSLQQVLQGTPGAQISVDIQRNAIIVSGDEQTHRIANQTLYSMEQQAAAAAGAPNGGAASESHAGGGAARGVTSAKLSLKHRRWSDVLEQMERLWGPPARKQQNAAQSLIFEYQPAVGGPLQVTAQLKDNSLILEGDAERVSGWGKVIEAIDRAPSDQGRETEVVPLGKADRSSVRKALSAFQRGGGALALATGSAGRFAGSALLGSIFQQQANGEQATEDELQMQAAQANSGVADALSIAQDAGLIGDVNIQFLEGLDVIVIEGRDSDVAKVQKIIEDIERLSAETSPEIDIVPLTHVDSASLANLIRTLYTEVLAPRQGSVSITELIKPNALLLIGRKESVASVKDLIATLDQPASPDAQFKVVRLKFAAAETVVQTLNAVYPATAQQQQPQQAGQAGQQTGARGLPVRISASADFRTNAVILRASPRDLLEAELLISKLDVADSGAVAEMRVFRLRNSRVEDVAEILRGAIYGATQGTSTGQIPGLPTDGQNNFQPQGGGQANANLNTQKSITVELQTFDRQNAAVTRSGLLNDVKIAADPRGNALLVTAPKETMQLVEALIQQLDQIPVAQMQIKVFEILNGDATALQEMLQTLFGQATTGQNQQGGGGFFGAAGTQDTNSGVVPLQLAVDQRTNSIIASGSSDDLLVVEAILARLDASNAEQRVNYVYKLNHIDAQQAAESLSAWLRDERTLRQSTQDVSNPFAQIEQEVVVVAEAGSNSLIVSASPRYYPSIKKVIEELDAKPEMVNIQVVIAEVSLNNTDEFGVELGLQDSVLFDRSVIGTDGLTLLNTTTQSAGNNQVVTQQVLTGNLTPGFNFNGTQLGTLGNSAATSSLARSNVVGTQGLSNFALGRVNQDLGYGGFVLSASSESVSLLLRALQACRRTEVLARPNVTVVENRQAFVISGERVPRISGTQTTTAGAVQATIGDIEDVGVILQVTPYVTPEGNISMAIDAERSNRTGEGVPIATGASGEIVESPIIGVSRVSTVVTAADGETVILGGLIGKRGQEETRRVPGLSSIPIIGNLFRYDLETKLRTELIVIMTPRLLRNQQDTEALKLTESARMSWCLADIVDLHGEVGLSGRYDLAHQGSTVTEYPTKDSGYEVLPDEDARAYLENGNPAVPTESPTDYTNPSQPPSVDETRQFPQSAPVSPEAVPRDPPPTPDANGASNGIGSEDPQANYPGFSQGSVGYRQSTPPGTVFPAPGAQSSGVARRAPAVGLQR